MMTAAANAAPTGRRSRRKKPLTLDEIKQAFAPLGVHIKRSTDAQLVAEIEERYVRNGFSRESAFQTDPCGMYPIFLVIANLNKLFSGRDINPESLKEFVSPFERNKDNPNGPILVRQRLADVGTERMSFVGEVEQARYARVPPSVVEPLQIIWRLLPEDGSFTQIPNAVDLAADTNARCKPGAFVRAKSCGAEGHVFRQNEKGEFARGTQTKVAVYPTNLYIGGKLLDVQSTEKVERSDRTPETVIVTPPPADLSGTKVLGYLKEAISKLESEESAKEVEIDEARHTLDKLGVLVKYVGEDEVATFKHKAEATLAATNERTQRLARLRQSLADWEEVL